MSLSLLVVDDSFAMRTLISDLLISDPAVTVVETARSGQEAIQKLSKVRFHCMTLDLVFPGEDGLSILKTVMRKYPLPVIVLSALSNKEAAISFQCLADGAVGFIPKPSGEMSLDIEKVKVELLTMVKAVSQVPPARLRVTPRRPIPFPKRRWIGLHGMIVIGASTGGPQTVEAILSSLPADFPVPILVVQHMPNRFFIEQFAERLDRRCHLRVKVACDGEPAEAGTITLAPPGLRLTVESPASLRGATATKQSRFDVLIRLTAEEPGGLTPSIDATMKSVAEVYTSQAIGIILSGMGHDGTEGMRAIKAAGGVTLCEDESSLLFGMPKSVIEAGLADQALPMEKIPEALAELVTEGASRTQQGKQ